jgi:hypothetical protein
MATKDYKARQRSGANRGRRGGSGFFWFITGALVGAFGVGLAWMLQGQAPPGHPQARQAGPKPATSPRFDFYQILPEMEVVVPDDELAERAPPPKPAPKAQPAQPPKPADKQAA